MAIDEFRTRLLAALHRAVPCDWVGINDIGPDPDSVVVVVDPLPPPELFPVFAELAYQNPLVDRYARTGDGRAYRFSDVVSRRELHALEIYDRVYRVLGQEYQIAFTLPNSTDRILGIALGRKRKDFGDGERDLLNAARPFLIQAYQNSIRYSELLADTSSPRLAAGIRSLQSLVALGLTDRQAQVVQLLATGAADADIADGLGISSRTVQKHLERCYRALNVHTRSEAAAIAWTPEP